ncbi:MAG: enoyl-CoA hydratase-related protein [Sulfobacillus sp.]|nr:enoyl-CoA hydratase-related protein [Sulfobacillus sp.]
MRGRRYRYGRRVNRILSLYLRWREAEIIENVLDYEQEGPIVTIWLNRPEVHNAVNDVLAKALRDAWTRFRDDETALVAILAGRGPSFSSGADLTRIEGLNRPDTYLNPDFIYRGTGYLGFTRMTDIFKPTIAAIHGYCVAGGLEMALWCDIRLAAANARFGCLERRWNVPLVDGGTQRLPRIVGWGRAMDLILTGREIDAETALAWGLVSAVTPEDTAYPIARKWAERMADYPQGALRTDKQAAMRGWGLPLEEALRTEAMLGMTQLNTPEFTEGVQRFRTRRTKGAERNATD